jgi:hypothetical protein
MGSVVSLRPHLRELPDVLPPREKKQLHWLPRVRDILENGLYANPEVRQLMDGVNNETSVYGRVAFDEKALVDEVVKALNKVNATVERHDYAKIAKAISNWMKERNLSRRARRIEARQKAAISATAAE